MEKYVLSSYFGKNNNAGSKAKKDINYFLGKMGYHVLYIKIPKNKLFKLIYAFILLPHLLRKKKIDELLFQYPIYSIFITKRIIKILRKNSNSKIIMLVHDYESMRIYKDDIGFQLNELKIFNSVDCLIVHNSKMESRMIKDGVHVPIVTIHLFDYLNNNPIFLNFNYDHNICFAGNLVKSNFLTKLCLSQCFMYIFGNTYKKKYPQNVKYKGCYNADELPKHIHYNFGLVWDGDSTHDLNNIYGYYQQYNSPHKISLYLSCGIPVIVNRNTAISSLVSKYNLGLVVNSLDNLNGLLLQVTQKDYNVMKYNAIKFSKKLRKGLMIMNALNKAEKIINLHGVENN